MEQKINLWFYQGRLRCIVWDMAEPIIDVKALAALARLDVAEPELESLKKDLVAIVGFVDAIQKASTHVVAKEPTLKNMMREDGEPHETGMYTEALLKNAPAQKEGRLVVKQVVSRIKK